MTVRSSPTTWDKLVVGTLLRADVGHLYRHHAPKYDRVMGHRRALGEKIAAAVRTLRGDEDINDVLDLACGTGLVIEGLRGGVQGKIMGIDTAEEMLDVARKKGIAQTDFQRGDINRLSDVPSGSADLVTLIGSSRFLSNIEAFHGEVGRILRPHGCLAATYDDLPRDEFWDRLPLVLEHHGLSQAGRVDMEDRTGLWRRMFPLRERAFLIMRQEEKAIVRQVAKLHA